MPHEAPPLNEEAQSLKEKVKASIVGFLREELQPAEVSRLESDEAVWDSLDSLAVLELIGKIEEEFDVEITGAEFNPQSLKTLSGIVDYTVACILAQKPGDSA